MGRGESEGWEEEPKETKTTQPKNHKDKEDKSSEGGGCPKCCLRTRDCLMSAECGRALQISSVIAFCGMCIRAWTCKSKLEKSWQYLTGFC